MPNTLENVADRLPSRRERVPLLPSATSLLPFLRRNASRPIVEESFSNFILLLFPAMENLSLGKWIEV